MVGSNDDPDEKPSSNETRPSVVFMYLNAAILCASVALWLSSDLGYGRVMTVLYPLAMSCLALATPTSWGIVHADDDDVVDGGGGDGGKYWFTYWLVFAPLKLLDKLVAAAAESGYGVVFDQDVAARVHVFVLVVLTWCLFGRGSVVVYENLFIPGLVKVCERTAFEVTKAWLDFFSGVVLAGWTSGVSLPVQLVGLALRRRRLRDQRATAPASTTSSSSSLVD